MGGATEVVVRDPARRGSPKRWRAVAGIAMHDSEAASAHPRRAKARGPGPAGCAPLMLALATLLALAAGSAIADPGALPEPGDPAWEPLVFRSIDRHTDYRVEEAPAEGARPTGPAWRARSDCAASGMLLPITGHDLAERPRLTWWWRVTEGLDVAAERTAAGDDFAARVYVLFRFDAAGASVAARVRHALGSRLARRQLPGTTLAYVWASRAPALATWPSPEHDTAHLIVRRTGSSASARDGWRREEVDVLADHRKAFGDGPAPEVIAIAIMSDSDATCRSAGALFSHFAFEPATSSPTAPPSSAREGAPR